jgi:hypothetical protein
VWMLGVRGRGERRGDGPGFEKVEEGGDAGEAELADEDGGVEACEALFFGEGFAAGFVGVGECFEDCVGGECGEFGERRGTDGWRGGWC